MIIQCPNCKSTKLQEIAYVSYKIVSVQSSKGDWKEKSFIPYFGESDYAFFVCLNCNKAYDIEDLETAE